MQLSVKKTWSFKTGCHSWQWSHKRGYTVTAHPVRPNWLEVTITISITRIMNWLPTTWHVQVTNVRLMSLPNWPCPHQLRFDGNDNWPPQCKLPHGPDDRWGTPMSHDWLHSSDWVYPRPRGHGHSESDSDLCNHGLPTTSVSMATGPVVDSSQY